MKHRSVGIPPLSGLTTAQEQKLSSTQLNNLLPPRARHWPYGKSHRSWRSFQKLTENMRR